MTNWFVPTADWLANSMSGAVLTRVELPDVQGQQTSLPTDKANYALQNVVNRVRGAIGKGNRTPLSQTAGSVPPEGVQFTLALTVESLVSSVPNMGWTITPEFVDIIKDAKAWLKDLASGEPTDWPTDPIGTDASGYQVATGTVGGDMQGEIDLSTDQLSTLPYVPPLPIGNVQYTGTQNPNGFQIGNVGDQFLLYSNGQLVSIWIKAGPGGTNTNWVVQTI